MKLLYMLMTMCMIMTMNIYISKDNEKKLRAYKGSMSGLINQLLDQFFKTAEKKSPVATPQITTASTPKGENGFYKLANKPNEFNMLTPEMPCCAAKKPCTHWVWQDSGKYINTLSGREREADL